MVLLTQFVLAQIDPLTAGAFKAAAAGADVMAGKDFKWWFLAVSILFGGFLLVALKLLLTNHLKNVSTLESQLNQQREANAALHERLINYITTDHQRSMDALTRMSESMDRLSKAIDDLDRHRTHP